MLPIASKIASQRPTASCGPLASTISAPCSAGCLVPRTGASTSGTPRVAHSCATSSVPAMPMVLVWQSTAPSRIASIAPASISVACTAGASASIVTTTSAPSAAAEGESATGSPSPSAFSRVRFHTRTS